MEPVDRIISAVQNNHPPDLKRRPRVTLSFAQSLDGSIAAERGRQLYLSGSESLKLTHLLRASHDGILVGVGTVLADNPRLTVRMVNGSNPRPIVLDSCLRTPRRSTLIENSRRAPWIFGIEGADSGRRQTLENAGARIFLLPEEDGRVDLDSLMMSLNQAGIKDLMVEGGAGIITSFLRARLVDMMVLTIAPVLVGGQRSLEMPLRFSRYGAATIEATNGSQFPGFREFEYLKLGEDLVVWGPLEWAEE